MKLLFLVERHEEYEIERVKEELTKRGIEFDAKLLKELYVEQTSDGGGIIFDAQGMPLANDYNFFLMRIFPNNFVASVLAKRLTIKNALNSQIFKQYRYKFDKFYQQEVFALNDIPIIKTASLRTENSFNAYLEQAVAAGQPKIIKHSYSHNGRSIQLVKTREDIVNLEISDKYPEFLVQDYIEIQEDYRIIVLGGEVLGVMRRTKGEGKITTNYTRGNTAEIAELPTNALELARKACEVLQVEFGGVDLIIDNKGNYLILEVNIFPGFKGFEQSTGINVAEKLLNFIANK
jgi:ribosomal protein S6--L-glutamate ligase